MVGNGGSNIVLVFPSVSGRVLYRAILQTRQNTQQPFPEDIEREMFFFICQNSILSFEWKNLQQEELM